jgi:hypothetical protein
MKTIENIEIGGFFTLRQKLDNGCQDSGSKEYLWL